MNRPRHQTSFASLVRGFLHALHGRMPVMVCNGCVRPTDEALSASGDFSLCDRCGASITSKTGVAVRTPLPEDSPE
jgi:NAD-dependent SIR2 family protein deacetylase